MLMRRNRFLVVLLPALAACTTAMGAAPGTAARDADRLVGTWELVSTRMTRGDSTIMEMSAPDIRAIKLLNRTHYSVVTLRGEQFLRAGTGRYTLNGDGYAETVELASGRYTPGRVYSFRIRVEGDTWTTDGGAGIEQFHEVWRRVR